MRLSSALTKWTIIPVLLFIISCASAPPDAEVESTYSFEGEIAIIGGHPFDRRIVLADSAGKFWNLSNPQLLGELINLAGHRVRVTGSFENASDGGMRLFVDRYELLPVDGKVPVIGILALEGQDLVLIDRDTHERFVLTGPLREALSHFQGFKVWVYGDKEPRVEDVGKVLDLYVEGYGILGPLNESTHYVPSDTLQDFHNR